MTDETSKDIAANGGSAVFANSPAANYIPTGTGQVAPKNLTIRNAPAGSDIAPGSTVSGEQDASVNPSPNVNPPATPSQSTAITPPAMPPTAPVNTKTLPTGTVSYEQAKNSLATGGLAGSQLSTAQDDLKKYYQGFVDTNAKTEPPTSGGDARTAMTDYNQSQSQPTSYDPAVTDVTLADNQAHQQFIKDYTDSQSSTAQTESLTQTYADLSKELGVDQLNTELMNAKNIIDGSEQDIRDEITKAGGFATNSQVMALTDARNKTLIQNYNNLLTTRDNAEQNLTTMLNLTEKDRDYAQQKINNQLDFDKENISYADKAVSNAQDVYKSMQQSEGWDGIYKAALASGDPQALDKINTTMGNGFDITSMAKQDAVTRATQNTKDTLAITNARQNITKGNLDITKAQNDLNDSSGLPNPAKANQPGYSSTGIKFNTQNASDQILNNFKSTGVIKDNVIPSANYNQAKAWWVQQGLNATEFDSIFGQYKNDQTNKQYN